MKACLILALLFITVSYLNGQDVNSTTVSSNDHFFVKIRNSDLPVTDPGTEFKLSPDSLIFKVAPSNYLRRRNNIHQMSGMVLFAGGSIIGALGISYGIANKVDLEKTGQNRENNFQKKSFNQLALTGLVMIAGSIPCFIHSIRNKYKWVKLTSQKTAFGPGPRASKKITCLTFAIPLGNKDRY